MHCFPFYGNFGTFLCAQFSNQKNLPAQNELLLGKGPKIKKRKSMVFDHRGGGGGHPKPNPYSDQGIFSICMHGA